MRRIVIFYFVLFISTSFALCQMADQKKVPSEPQPCTDPFSVNGKTEVVQVLSPGLENNLLGDSPNRSVSVYLPPGYESSPANRYPVIYFLHSYTANHTSFFGGTSVPGLDFTTILDKIYNSSAAPPVILVSPNSHNKFRGSFYTNSFVTGAWEDFITEDVIQYVEANYRTLSSRESRGIAGHSMGGYGTIKLAMRHPDIFSAAYMQSAAALDLYQYTFGRFAEENNSLEEALNGENFDDLTMYAQTLVAMAAAYAPDSTASPFPGQLPVDTSGTLIDSVWQQWLQHDPSTMIRFYKDNLMQYSAIQFDCGTSDQFYFYDHNESFSDSLDHHGIAHVFESYAGGHNSNPQRIETRLLPFFFENLAHEVPGIIRKSAWNLDSSDSLVIEMDLDGTIYIVPDSTGTVLDSILEKQVISRTATSDSDVVIHLSEIEYGEYVAYGVDQSNSGISLPVPFAVVPFIPEIIIQVTDFSTGDPIAKYELNIDGRLYVTDSLGEVSLNGCGADNSYSISTRRYENYAAFETNVIAYSDTTFMISLIEDSYLRVVDRATQLPIQGAFVKYGNSAFYTNDHGIVRIQDLRSEELAYSIEHHEYFLLADTSSLISGDTLIAELTPLVANIEFQVNDESGPVAGIAVNLGGMTVNTNNGGIASFIYRPARTEYQYTIEKPCYSQVFDSLFLEIDTLIHITLMPDTNTGEVDAGISGDTIYISSSSSGHIYVVPPGTERQADSILAATFFTFPIVLNDPLYIHITEIPSGEYWVYFVDQCENVSEELTLGVGWKDLRTGKPNIYPNPVSDLLIIEFNQLDEYTAEITSLNGRLLLNHKVQEPIYQIDLSSLHKGVYFITIRSKDFVSTRIIVKL